MSEKLGAKFPATRPGCSMVKIGCLDDTFLEVFLTTSKPSRRSITAEQQKQMKRRKSKGGKKFEKID